jgi:NTE family protein
MEQMVTSKEFQEIATGIINGDYKYYFKQNPSEASWITFHFSLDTSIITSIPTHLVSPLPIDFAIMKYFSAASSASHDKFDSLFVPFRCVAADITAKKPYVFDSGNLGQAIRASIAYPFYLKPITVNGRMLFDGGLYNNFPTDIMQQSFNPDIVIGSNVSGNIEPPTDDNILSEIKNMLMTKTNYELVGKGLIILPNVEAGILTANNPKALIDSGYNATIRQLPSLLKLIERREDASKLKQKRENFEKKEHPMVFNKLAFTGVNANQEKYLRRVLLGNNKKVSINQMAPAYFKIASDQNIHSIYPMAVYNDTTGYYTLDMAVKKEKHFQVGFGGVLSNLPISEGYVGLQYNTFGSEELELTGNTYFGKLYTSVLGSARIYFPSPFPFYIEPSLIYNSWNYYSSSNEFSQNITPPYLIQYEGYGKVDLGLPVGAKSKLILGGAYTEITNTYFQQLSYKTSDTPDQTTFNAATGYAKFDYNSLNEKEYATSGTRLLIHAQWIAGTEQFTPGTQDVSKDTVVKQHNWLQLKLSFDKYFLGRGPVRLGLYLEGVYSNTFINGHALQTYFQNYWSTALMAPAFEPTPEMQTLFLQKYRAYNYGAGGPKLIIAFMPKVDLRFEGYVFIPYQAIQQNANNQADYGKVLATKEYVGMAALVYHSPIGPVSVSLNYFDGNPLKYSFSVLFHVGFIIFNERSIN